MHKRKQTKNILITTIKLSMPIKEAEILEDFCKKKECSKAGFIREAIKEKISRDSSI